mmetsp:Transcript_5546/g.6517  ORF Transcript_5546/g.6517 Transcript_5546/m.6517 type:complete len:432 (-) Transcript_5546:915-2210(-)
MSYKVAFISDFFFPRLGGVEMHIWTLSQCLLRMGHKVIVITHAAGDRKGVRYMTNGLKVYYVPWNPFHEDNSFPGFFTFFPLFRDIMIREQIEIVHGHGAASSLVHETMLHAKTMGLRTCYTDHSLFGFNDSGGIHLNKVLKFSFASIDRAIAVSHVCRENLVLRVNVKPEHVFTIPNAVDASSFVPDPSLRPKEPRINIVYVGRLAHRKGIDFIAQVIPVACAKFPQVNFIIGGGGPKRLVLDEMVEKHQLQNRVELLGQIPYSRVRSVMCRGTIFLQCSLTESFGSAIVEAACCGLFVVATGVGGVPEVLPPSMIRYTTEHNVESILEALEEAIEITTTNRIDPYKQHQQVQKLYSWKDVAYRTVKVYDCLRSLEDDTWEERMTRYLKLGPISGIFAVFLAMVDFLLYRILQWIKPDDAFDIMPFKCRG